MASDTDHPIHLDDLVQPIGSQRFLTEHLLTELPFLSAPNPALVDALRALDVFKSPEALIARLTRPVVVMGPNYFRGQIAPGQALNFLHQRFTLYILSLEEELAEVRALTHHVTAELGAANLGIVVEAFIALPGSISTMHYDHDLNFQILLDGEKRWRVAPNDGIRNPTRSYHPTRRPDGGFAGFSEEVYARDPAMKVELPPNAAVFEARPGTTMFVPRGWWHEVVAETACFGVNFVLKGTTWASGISTALSDLLLGDEAARAFCYGAFSGNAALERDTATRFEAIRGRAIEILKELTLEEVYLGGKNAVFVWSASANDRALVEVEGGWMLVAPGVSEDPLPLEGVLLDLVRKLVALQHPFRWEHLMVLAQAEIRGDVGAVGLWNVLADLVEAGYLERLPARSR